MKGEGPWEGLGKGWDGRPVPHGPHATTLISVQRTRGEQGQPGEPTHSTLHADGPWALAGTALLFTAVFPMVCPARLSFDSVQCVPQCPILAHTFPFFYFTLLT